MPRSFRTEPTATAARRLPRCGRQRGHFPRHVMTTELLSRRCVPRGVVHLRRSRRAGHHRGPSGSLLRWTPTRSAWSASVTWGTADGWPNSPGRRLPQRGWHHDATTDRGRKAACAVVDPRPRSASRAGGQRVASLCACPALSLSNVDHPRTQPSKVKRRVGRNADDDSAAIGVSGGFSCSGWTYFGSLAEYGARGNQRALRGISIIRKGGGVSGGG